MSMERGGPPARPIGASEHLPQLDGLRAVAVYLVVAFHAGLDGFVGGFIGVDVFFVLSGYLVTTLLLRDLADHGSIRLWHFYARRVRRLLPAAAVALLTTAIVYSAIASPSAVDRVTNGFVASFLYVANWFFVHRSTDYFSAGADPSPVLHFWSLAVEEQFYVVWPLVFGALAVAGRRLGRGRNLVPALIGCAALASVTMALVVQDTQPERAYYATDTRAYQLLAGALLATVPGLVTLARRRPTVLPWVASAAVVALVASASSLVEVSPIERGVLATLLTSTLLVALVAGRRGPVHALLSWEPIAYLGRISYGTYLWHWPVIVVAAEITAPSPIPLLGLVALVATGIASLSHQLLEQPIRRSIWLERHARAAVGAGLAVSLVGGLVLVPRALDTTRGSAPTAVASVGSGSGGVPDNIDLDEVYRDGYFHGPDCVDRDLAECTLVKGTGLHLLLMGDSNAEMMIPAFASMAREEGFTFSVAVRPGCPWQRDFYVLTAAIRDACRRSKADWYDRSIPTLDPDLVIVLSAEPIREEDGRQFVDRPYNRGLRDYTLTSLRTLTSTGRQVIAVKSVPFAAGGFNPLDCLATAEVREACRFVAPPGPTWLDGVLEAEAEAALNLSTLDLDALACPFLPICDPIVNGRVTYWNDAHLTAAYAASLGPALAEALRAQGLIPAGSG